MSANDYSTSVSSVGEMSVACRDMPIPYFFCKLFLKSNTKEMRVNRTDFHIGTVII